MAKAVEIKEDKIRHVIWMLKIGKTKKDCCTHLGINYNTKRLAKIVDDFKEKEERIKELKLKNRKKVFTEDEKTSICNSYLNGESQAGIARLRFVSPQRIKAILEERKIPIRSKSKAASKMPQAVQDLSKEIKIGDKVFIERRNFFATVSEIYDKSYLEKLEKGKLVRVDLKSASNKEREREGIHYTLNVVLDNKRQINLRSAQDTRSRILKTLEKKEKILYKVNRDDEFAGQYCFPREDLFFVS